MSLCMNLLPGLEATGALLFNGNGWAQGRIQDFSWEVAESKKWVQFGPCGPHVNWAYWHFGPHFCLYGPDFGPKLALFMTRIRNFFHKISMFWPKNRAFSYRGGGQGPLAPAPVSAPGANTSLIQSDPLFYLKHCNIFGLKIIRHSSIF